jgi:hypothetical protein
VEAPLLLMKPLPSGTFPVAVKLKLSLGLKNFGSRFTTVSKAAKLDDFAATWLQNFKFKNEVDSGRLAGAIGNHLVPQIGFLELECSAICVLKVVSHNFDFLLNLEQ